MTLKTILVIVAGILFIAAGVLAGCSPAGFAFGGVGAYLFSTVAQ